MKTLDRYVLRETLGPFLLALTLFTFLVQTRPMLDEAQQLLAKGLDLATVAQLLALLLPQALGVTIPMAFLAGTLMGLGRLSGDREGVALLACGVSPLRLLRPLVFMAAVVGAADMYTLVKLVPAGNQAFREKTFAIFVKQSEGDIQPGLFYEGFPNKVLFVRERLPGTTKWSGVFLADTSQPGTAPVVTLAESGYLDIDKDHRLVTIVLPGDALQYVPSATGDVYDVRHATDVRLSVPSESVFGDGNINIAPGIPEMTIAQLRAEEARKRAANPPISPHPEIMQRHQMFSFPVACLVFAVIGLPLGLHTRKEGTLGGFALGIGVIFVYYGVMQLCAGLTKGQLLPAEWSRWVPNIVVGLAGVALGRWRLRSAGRELSIPMPAWIRTRLARASNSSARTADVRVIIRVPAWRLPRPRLLDLYVARWYLSVSLLSFVGLVGLYYISTLIDKSERLAKGQATLAMLVEYFYYSTPQFITYVAPMAVLVAVLATVGGLMRSGELVVMRACGVSLYRAAVPLVALALVWSGLLFLLDDRVLAQANKRAARLDEAIRGLPPTLNVATGRNWRTDAKGRIYYYAYLDPAALNIYGVSEFQTAKQPYRLLSHTFAARAAFAGSAWTADSGWTEHFNATGRSVRETFAHRAVALPPASFFKDAVKDPDLMTFTELWRHIRDLNDSGLNLAESRVTLQERIAFPLVTLVMTILGIPFGMTTGRRGALYGIGLAVILGSAYWLLNTFFLAVGQAALLPPALAAWAANILFLSAAAYYTLTVRT